LKSRAGEAFPHSTYPAGALIIGKPISISSQRASYSTRALYGAPRSVFNADYGPGGSNSGSDFAESVGEFINIGKLISRPRELSEDFIK
jgi:hypothetical protein